jgi:hypothetical protein
MKKHLLLLLLALTATGLPAQMPSPAETPSATLDVKESRGTNKEVRSVKGNDYERRANVKQDIRTVALTITAGTLGHAPFSAQVEWYFIEKDLQTKRDHVFDHGSKTVTLKAGADVQFDAVSKQLKSSVTNDLIYGMSELTPKVSGGKPNGWIVRVSANGNVLVVRGSTPSLEEAGNNPGLLEKLMGDGPAE